MSKTKYSPGDVFSLRLPNTLTEKELEGLNELKNKLGRDFNKNIVPIFLKSINEYLNNEKEITVPLPEKLTTDQEAQYNNPLVQQLIGQLVYQLILNPAQPIQISTNIEEKEININQEKNETDNFKSSFGAKFVTNNLFDDDDDD